MEANVRYVQPGGLRCPPERADGADPMKLQDQFNEFGMETGGMPPLEIIEAAGGALVIYNGVTRATRSYLADPERLVPMIVTGSYPQADVSHLLTIEETLTPDF